jgi:hypothetical protein
MTPSKLNEKELNQADRKKIMSALFQDFVIQHGQTALVMLGRMPGTDGQLMTDPDPEAAKTLIDQLEMLRDKTRGNLLPEERDLLDRSIAVLQKDFAKTMESMTEAGSQEHIKG